MRNKIPLVLFGLITFLSCKKDVPPVEKEEQEHIQYFEAVINGEKVRVESTYSWNRDKLNGHRTEIGFDGGAREDMYNLNVTLPQKNEGLVSKIRFQILDLDRRTQKITGEVPYYNSAGTFIVYYKKPENKEDDPEFYVPHADKPFIAEITKIEYPEWSVIPYVGGKLHGVLYSEINPRDSIIIEDGMFEVRF